MVVLKPSGTGTLIGNVVMAAVAIIAVALRMVAKAKIRQSFRWEDLLIVLALAMFCSYVAVIIYTMYKAGGTLEVAEMSLESMNLVLKLVFILEFLMTTVITLVKLSILLWYCTVFSSRTVLIPTRVAGALCIAWYVATTLALALQCIPIRDAWNYLLETSDKCAKFGELILGYEVSNIFIDAFILCIPIAVVRSLHLSMRKKIAVGAIFLSGGFIIVTCAIRITYIYHANGAPVDPYGGLLWSSIELGVAILCACLPTLRPLFPKEFLIPSLSQFRNLISTRSTSFAGTSKRSVSRVGTTDTESSRYLNLEHENISLQKMDQRNTDIYAV